jgi:hypothetical protein
MPLPTPQTDLACVPKVIGWTVLFQENMSSVLVIEGGGRGVYCRRIWQTGCPFVKLPHWLHDADTKLTATEPSERQFGEDQGLYPTRSIQTAVGGCAARFSCFSQWRIFSGFCFQGGN